MIFMFCRCLGSFVQGRTMYLGGVCYLQFDFFKFLSQNSIVAMICIWQKVEAVDRSMGWTHRASVSVKGTLKQLLVWLIYPHLKTFCWKHPKYCVKDHSLFIFGVELKARGYYFQILIYQSVKPKYYCIVAQSSCFKTYSPTHIFHFRIVSFAPLQ